MSTSLSADDTPFLACGLQHRGITTKLSKAYKSVDSYCDRWRIRLNVDKTEAIMFPIDNKRRRRPPDNQFVVLPAQDIETTTQESEAHVSPHAGLNNEVRLTYTSSARYLGITFDCKLTFGKHLSLARNKAIGAVAALYPLLGKSSKLSTNAKLRLYKSIIRPIMLYGSPVWAGAAKSHLKGLQTVQNRVLKIIFKLDWRHPTIDIHNRAEIPMIDEYIHHLNANFRDRCESSEFPLIKELFDQNE